MYYWSAERQPGADWSRERRTGPQNVLLVRRTSTRLWLVHITSYWSRERQPGADWSSERMIGPHNVSLVRITSARLWLVHRTSEWSREHQSGSDWSTESKPDSDWSKRPQVTFMWLRIYIYVLPLLLFYSIFILYYFDGDLLFLQLKQQQKPFWVHKRLS